MSFGIDSGKLAYVKPVLIKINLLDETALGDTFSPEEPPFPAPPRGGVTPTDSTTGGFSDEQKPA